MNEIHEQIYNNMKTHLGKENPKISVDFDGTLCKQAFPEIGFPNIHLIDFLIHAKSQGALLILNTLREDNIEVGPYAGRKLLTEAINWCMARGLTFHAHNENTGTDIMMELYGWIPRKVAADLYIDDRNVLFFSNIGMDHVDFHAAKPFGEE